MKAYFLFSNWLHTFQLIGCYLYLKYFTSNDGISLQDRCLLLGMGVGSLIVSIYPSMLYAKDKNKDVDKRWRTAFFSKNYVREIIFMGANLIVSLAFNILFVSYPFLSCSFRVLVGIAFVSVVNYVIEYIYSEYVFE